MVVWTAALFTSQIWAEAPWDFNQPSQETAPPQARSLLAAAFNTLVAAYRANEAQTTITRCAFDVTCSHFAERAFSRYGFVVGSVLFVDRYFYRENADSRFHYPLIGEPDGTFRLDDSPFLP